MASSPDLVALTGGTGFIGVHLAMALHQAGYRLRLLTRRLPVHPLLSGFRFEAVPGDLDDRDALRRLTEGAAAVVHLAGAIKARSKAEFFAANAAGVENLAAVAQASGTSRFVLVSSLAAREPLISDYAASKREGEERLKRVAARLRWCILRPAAVYGPWDRETLAVFRFARLGVAPMLGPSEGRLGLIHVNDVVAAVLAALVGAGEGGVHEIDDGQPGGHSWPEMIAAAGRAVGRRPLMLPVPGALLYGVGALNWGIAKLLGQPCMVSPGKVNEIRHRDWSVGVASFAATGRWSAKVGLEQGFAATTAWYRAAGWL